MKPRRRPSATTSQGALRQRRLFGLSLVWKGPASGLPPRSLQNSPGTNRSQVPLSLLKVSTRKGPLLNKLLNKLNSAIPTRGRPKSNSEPHPQFEWYRQNDPSGARPTSVVFSPDAPTTISSKPPLNARLHQWIVQQSSEEIADRFYPWVQETLQDLEYDLEEPASDETFRRVKAALRRADITPSRMAQAVEEAQRAADEDLSTLKWIREVQGRAFSEELAEKTVRLAERQLTATPESSKTDLQAPPSAERIFVFFLVWEEMGGTSTFAALREAMRQGRGRPPSN